MNSTAKHAKNEVPVAGSQFKMPNKSDSRKKLIIAIIILSCVVTLLVTIIACFSCSNQEEVITEEEPAVEEVITQQPQTTVAPTPTMSASMQATQAQVAQVTAQYGQNVSVAVLPLDGNSAGFNINGDDRFVSASMIKLLILANFISACDSGQLNCQATYTVKSSDIVGGTGSIQSSGAGATYTYDELAHYMIKCSDNTAANILIDTLGMSNINNTAATLGLTQTQLNRKMMDTSSGVENYISANDAANILHKIGNKTLGSAAMCEKAIKYLTDQEDNVGLAQGLGSGVNFAHKTGSLKNCRHDGGIEYANSPYIVVCLCDIGTSTGNSFMQQVGNICSSNLN